MHPGHSLVNLADRGHIREVQLGVNALREHIHRQRHDIDVAGALAVAEEGAFNAVGAGQYAQFRVRDRASAVVVRMEGDDDRIAVFEVVAHILDLVRVDVGHRQLNGDREIDDGLVVGRRLPDVQNSVADFECIVRLGSGEGLGRVFKPQVGIGGFLELFRQIVKQLCARNGDVEDLFLRFAENLGALSVGSGIVQMDDRFLDAAQRLKRLADDVFSRLGQNLDRYVVRDQVLLDQRPQKFVFGLACGGEADFDLLKADLDEELEELQLLFEVHRDNQRLVSVAQIDRAPDRRFFDVILLHPACRGVGYGVILTGVLLVIHNFFSFLSAQIIFI